MTSSPSKRPLSPHLQVYRLPMTAVMSITHRASGAALAVGTLLAVWILSAAAIGEGAYNAARAVAGSPLGLFTLFGWSAALYYHLCNGIRHLIWDTARMLELKSSFRSGLVVLLAAFILTLATWYCALT